MTIEELIRLISYAETPLELSDEDLYRLRLYYNANPPPPPCIQIVQTAIGPYKVRGWIDPDSVKQGRQKVQETVAYNDSLRAAQVPASAIDSPLRDTKVDSDIESDRSATTDQRPINEIEPEMRPQFPNGDWIGPLQIQQIAGVLSCGKTTRDASAYLEQLGSAIHSVNRRSHYVLSDGLPDHLADNLKNLLR